MSRTEDPSGHWSTWEELLLAFAVNRHGTKSWESIAVEIQNRTASSLLLTGHNCKQKYQELQQRFTAADEKTDGADDGSEIGDSKKVPWLDELRQLRVAELKREVHRYDVSIGSLQSKVKKLREERDQSLKETSNGEEKPDLEKDRAENEREAEKRDMEKRSKRISGDDSDRENQSFNESNSTDSKDRDRTDEGKRKAEVPFPKPEQEAEAAPGKPDQAASGESPEDKAVGEGSYNGSSDTVAKGAVVSSATKSPAPVPASEAGESAEFRESVAESKGGEEGTKENSDVQSSASLSKKRRRKKAIPGSSSGEEPEPEEVSPVSKRISVKSQPLVGFLEIIRSHKHGSVFERRLESQESSRYNGVIRQHLDLETVRAKLEGLYSDRSPEFFRDLLLLFTNAVVFFPKNSIESIAAITLREIVCKELSRSFPKPSPPSKELAPPPPSSSLPKSAPEPSDSLQPKPVSSGPVIPCGKRSSASAKSQLVPETLADEKPDSALPKEAERSSAVNLAAVEPRITKKRTRERSSSRGARSNNSRGNGSTAAGTRLSNPIPIPNPSSNASNAAAKASVSNENSEVKTEKKSANSPVVAKKRSAAANFLNRMKRSLSSSSERTLLDTLKSAINSSSSPGGGQDQKKKGGKGDGRRDSSLRQGSSAKQVVERRSTAGKRSVGRPPKRAATPAQTLSRRAKEPVEAESKPPPRKRSRR